MAQSLFSDPAVLACVYVLLVAAAWFFIHGADE